MHTLAPPVPPTFREALAFWLRLGFVSFGGPAGQIAIMHEYLVDKKRWISETKFLHALNYCMLLPGPEAQQLATYTGWLLHGLRGGLAAGLLFVLPSALILLVLSALYVSYGHLAVVQAAFEFLKPAVLAIVAGAILKIGKRSLQTPWHVGVAAAAFAAIFWGNVPFPILVLAALVAGALSAFRRKQAAPKPAAMTEGPAETSYVIHSGTVTGNSGFSLRRLLKQLAAAIVLWSLPLLLLVMLAPNADFWKKLCFFFSKAALVTFGGAYAVLPYVAQVSVERFGWLSQLEMLDGLALGETTPGPLIIVLAFVGFMAGFHSFQGALAAGALALAVTVYYTFLPSFFFIFAGAPWIERTQSNPAVQSILQWMSAVVVGVILSLCLYLGHAVLAPAFPEINWLAVAWLAVSILALQVFKVNMIAWIGVSMAVGIIRYWL